MGSVDSFNDALEAARRLFSNATSDQDARALSVELRSSGKLGLSVLRNYLPQAAYFSDERAEIISTLLEGMSNDGLDMVPLLPVFLPLLTSPEQQLRDTITEIACRLGEDATPAENVALGCLRNPDADIRLCGAKILNAIAPWCGRALKGKLNEMLPLVAGENPTEGLLKTAILRCRDEIFTARRTKATEPAALTLQGVDANGPITKSEAALHVPDLTGKFIFFADDDPQIRSLIARLLNNAGAALQMASDGEEAMHMIDEMITEMRTPSLAILDLRMPGENGMRVLEHLRRFFPPTQTPAIILTAVKDQQIIVTAMQKYNLHSYLIKPVSLTEFYTRIASALCLPAAP